VFCACTQPLPSSPVCSHALLMFIVGTEQCFKTQNMKLLTHFLFPSADVVYPHRFCVPRVKRHCAASYIKPPLHSVTHKHMFSNLQSIWSTFIHIFKITKLPYLPKWILKKRKISIYARFATLICEKKEFSCHDFKIHLKDIDDGALHFCILFVRTLSIVQF
jgi:hypothetical protein